MKKQSADIAIIGAGAAGMMAAHFCALDGKKVIILEHNDRVGRKILISGGGRCNFTNIHSGPDDFVSENPHFCKSALSRFTPYDFIDLIEKHQIQYHEKKLGQLFCNKSAKEINSMLLNLIDKKNISLELGAKNLQVKDCLEGFVISNKELEVECSSLIIATGGLSIPPIGATDFGHKLAKSYGHKIIPATPALVPFTYNGFEKLSGISTIAKLRCGHDSITEDVLFTHKGLSGPAVLKTSLYWQANSPIEINWLPDNQIKSVLEDTPGKTKISSLLKKFFATKLVGFFLEKININENTNLSDLNKDDITALELVIHSMQLIPNGTEGFRKAEVTRGGVDTKQISSKTMESNLKPGLYFIGEVLDVTGQLGGHNFQWAWASAYAAGEALK